MSDARANPIEVARGRLAGSIRQLIAGDRRPPAAPAGDAEGLLPADAAARRVHADASMFVGGLRALLLQTLHPLAMAGVADHSDYRTDPWGRLHRTGQFIGLTTFGTRDEAMAIIDRVSRIHRRVEGVAPDGRSYRASDPRLLTWVHLTEVDSFLAAHQRYAAQPLGPSDADRYIAEMAQVAELLGAEDVPRTVEGVHAAIRRYRPELVVGRQAREAVGFLLAPPVPLTVRPAYSLVSAAAIGLLPGWARRKLWLPAPPLADPLLVRPAVRALLGAVGWALGSDQPREPAA
jgi:uncharacterized protein (DUF2236 family)